MLTNWEGPLAALRWVQEERKKDGEEICMYAYKTYLQGKAIYTICSQWDTQTKGKNKVFCASMYFYRKNQSTLFTVAQAYIDRRKKLCWNKCQSSFSRPRSRRKSIKTRVERRRACIESQSPRRWVRVRECPGVMRGAPLGQRAKETARAKHKLAMLVLFVRAYLILLQRVRCFNSS